MLDRLSFWYDRLVRGLVVLASGAVILMLVMIVGDVTSRTLGFGSWVTSLPITELALLYFTVLSAPYLVRMKAHVAVESFVKMMPISVQRVALWIVFAGSVLACLVIAIISVQMLAEAVSSGEMVMGGIDVPFWLYALPLPVCYLLVAVEFLLMAVRGESIYSTSHAGSL